MALITKAEEMLNAIRKKREDSHAPHPYKSTTHEERFFHVDFHLNLLAVISAMTKHECSHKTIFCRKEVTLVVNDFGDNFEKEEWFASVAYCDARDQFSREMGRKMARRKYFQGKRAKMIPHDKEQGPLFEDAVVFDLNHAAP